MKEKFQELNIAAIEADLTEDDPKIWEYLHENFNRANLPVNVIYPADPNRPPIILPEVITQATMLEGIEAAQ